VRRVNQVNWVEKVNRIENAGNIIFQSLMEMIYDNKLKPGQKLRQDYIAQMFEVSRVPVRDALQMLIGTGLATRIPRKGIIVSLLSRQILKELYEIRKILEGSAIRIVVRNINTDVLDTLDNLIEKQHELMKNNDLKAVIKIDYEFFKILYNASTILNNSLSELIYSNLLRVKHARCAAISKPEFARDWMEDAYQKNKEKISALKSKDEEYVYKVIIKIINDSEKKVLNHLEKIGWLVP